VLRCQNSRRIRRRRRTVQLQTDRCSTRAVSYLLVATYSAEFDRILTLQSGGSQSGRPFHSASVLNPGGRLLRNSISLPNPSSRSNCPIFPSRVPGRPLWTATANGNHATCTSGPHHGSRPDCGRMAVLTFFLVRKRKKRAHS